MPADKPEPSLGELFSELARETSTLVKQEVRLATTEMSAKASTAAKQAGSIGVGAALLHTGLLVFAAALILGLGAFIPMWLSALVVGVIVTGAGYVFVQKGIHGLKGIDPVPAVTVQTLKEDQAWLKQQAR